VQAGRAAATARQRDIQCFRLELRPQLGIGHGLSTGMKRCLDLRLGRIDLGTACLLFLNRQAGQGLQQLRDPPGFAQVARFGVFQISSRWRGFKVRCRGSHQRFKLVHAMDRKKKAVTTG